ncbi:MAG: SDR family oxidoreductase [Clostridia bacterium]|nr:SDR family oxidoreductase [Clostridia bacterium]MBR5279090.1 SDR family oxidoreductase [Clostridia bacterium]
MIKSALVTGGAKGIGREVCKTLSQMGYRVYIHCNKSIEEANALCAELGNATVIQADLANPQSVNIIADLCKDVSVIINNAGAPLVDMFDNVSVDASNRLFQINLLSAMNIVRKILPNMLSRKEGNIVNISSVFGESGGSCEVDYSTTKAALIGFTKALAKEVGPSGIRVNCICPGIIDTDMNENLSFEDIDAICDEIPLGRMGEPQEIAHCVEFLVSDKSKYITGSIIDINGGWQA